MTADRTRKTTSSSSASKKATSASKKTSPGSAAKKASPDSAKETTSDSTKKTTSDRAKKTTSDRAKKTTSDSASQKAASSSTKKPAPRRASAPRAESRPRPSGVKVAEGVAQQLALLIRKPVEAVTGLGRNEDGWRFELEVLEMRRIPETTDVLALYEVEADDDGNLTSYRRIERYARGLPRKD